MASKDQASDTELQEVGSKGEMAVGLQSVSDEAAASAVEGAPDAPASTDAPVVQTAPTPPPQVVEKSCSRGLAA